MPKFKWSRELDPIALAALALSVLLASAHVVERLRGAELHYYDDLRVLLVVAASPNDGRAIVNPLLHMSYYNTGKPGRPDLVLRESVQIQIRHEVYPYQWNKFVTYEYDNLSPEPRLTLKTAERTLPVWVDGGAMAQNISYYSPVGRQVAEPVTYENTALVQSRLLRALADDDPIEILLTFDTLKSRQQSRRYELLNEPMAHSNLAPSGRGWHVFRLRRVHGD